MRWLVDGNNVMGSRPDGWWNDRPRAMARLVQEIADWVNAGGAEVTVVFDGRPHEQVTRLAGGSLAVEFATAPRGRDAADDRIVESAHAVADPTSLVVVTADRGLVTRLPEAVVVEGPRRFLDRLADAAP